MKFRKALSWSWSYLSNFIWHQKSSIQLLCNTEVTWCHNVFQTISNVSHRNMCEMNRTNAKYFVKFGTRSHLSMPCIAYPNSLLNIPKIRFQCDATLRKCTRKRCRSRRYWKYMKINAYFMDYFQRSASIQPRSRREWRIEMTIVVRQETKELVEHTGGQSGTMFLVLRIASLPQSHENKGLFRY